MVTGGLGFIFAATWWQFYRKPSQHSALGEVERAQIFGGAAPAPVEKTKPDLRVILTARRFWGVALSRFLTEPAWHFLNFWIPLYLHNERGMDIKEIALFAWMPFLAADIGSMTGGFLSPFAMRHFGMRLIPSRLTGMVLGAICMIGPACVGLVGSPMTAIALLCLGGFAHQMISTVINALSADVFPSKDVGTASGFAGMAAWTGGLGYSLLVGALVEKIGYTPFLLALGVFDIVAAIVAITLLRNQTPVEARSI
jgi:ACS family hexuronate transporter-like MFS transporter